MKSSRVVPHDPQAALLLALLAAEREVLAELKGLRADLARDRDRRPAAPGRDNDALKLLLAAAVAGRAFSAREVVQHAEAVDGPLRAALDTAGLGTARKLGKWLRSIEGRESCGLRLDRLGVDNAGAVWIFRTCESADSHSHSHAERNRRSI